MLTENRNIIENFFGINDVWETYAALRIHEIEGTNGKLPPDPEAKKRQMARYDAVHRRRKKVMSIIGKSDGLRSSEVQEHFKENIWKDLTVLRKEGLITSRKNGSENVWKLTVKGAKSIKERRNEAYKTAKQYQTEKREASIAIIINDLKSKPFSDASAISNRTKLNVTSVRRYLNDMCKEKRVKYMTKKLPQSSGKGTRPVRFWVMCEAAE